MPRVDSKQTVNIRQNSDDFVLFSPADYDNFMLTQREVFDACLARQRTVSTALEMTEAFEQMLKDIKIWCAQHGVANCVIAPRMDDILVVLVAPDEDDGGKLHDEMSALDLELFRRNQFRLFWMLLRSSEVGGLSAFLDPKSARTIFVADAQTASSGSR